ncbi:uncharacterized protein LOC131351305 [Hemibagrus wyckioides]|uniref:uncharacterized protein LOC131351305 n=1 Tax=Hemibagrus wyckioides TaxID=337641 RepID=UPI00266B7838|nr:uncharacterized protein LOC131351305 [Hemibagrus wyckioides]XP_058242674.1 uncharacterized protein LOC131351305 [Hemibagrus wyckioides]XP_058242676.1 uncharacterized protein LOC131351305 [Hemibagrus wyckioides]XP_058242677.1 uncharacterized protein LOC131351305 [Hemibagrus wyckioides]XP_058242678.1 uncharacterized protein LOC131351305 [Hemibagrus wyckioides]XP_058242679.1 uncharacterized protein LOC131351305 [Hemibagrus wyckioides]XP_058242680.1 uncharacterized protein LOC131351305 [Hemiba
MQTLKEIDQLEQSRFGQPPPRHGLKLLYWFATDCLTFNQNDVMQSCCYPEKGQFGFHIFENKHEKNVGKLLPIAALPYYEVGNLSKAAAYSLPPYVREDYKRKPDATNMDRIIVSFNKNNNCFDRVYVTQHRDLSNFNKDFTFHISKRLIMMIKDLTLEEFLLKTGYLKQQPNRFPCLHSEEPSNRQPLCPALPTSESQRILMTNNTEEHPKAPPETSICMPASISFTKQDLHAETESISNLMKNNTQEHHETPPTSFIYSPGTTSTTHDIHLEVESPSILVKNHMQGHLEPSPASFIYSPATTSSTTQDFYLVDESPPILVKNHTQGHHEAPTTSFIYSPATTYTETESHHIININTQIHTTSAESQLNNVVQDPPSKDISTTSTCTPTITSGTESSPFSQFTSFFWGFYFLCLFSFFYFFWGNITQICILLYLSASFPWQNWKRRARGKEMRNEEKKRNRRKQTESSPFLQFSSFFYGFYFLSLFFFFYFFWGNLSRIFMIGIFVASCRWQNRKNKTERERERERERENVCCDH